MYELWKYTKRGNSQRVKDTKEIVRCKVSLGVGGGGGEMQVTVRLMMTQHTGIL